MEEEFYIFTVLDADTLLFQRYRWHSYRIAQIFSRLKFK